MKCKTCGFAASDPNVTVCPFCTAQGNVGAPPGGMMPAYAVPSSQAGAAVWPPAPTAPAYAPFGGVVDREAVKQQRQAGILMAVIPLVVVQAVSRFWSLLPAPWGSAALTVVLLACIYPHFRGCAHWAESKGYPRYEGRLLAILGWLGVLFLAIRRDKTPSLKSAA